MVTSFFRQGPCYSGKVFYFCTPNTVQRAGGQPAGRPSRRKVLPEKKVCLGVCELKNSFYLCTPLQQEGGNRKKLTQGLRPGGGLQEREKKTFEKGLEDEKEFVPLSSLLKRKPLTESVRKKSFGKGLQDEKFCLPLQPASGEKPSGSCPGERERKKLAKVLEMKKEFPTFAPRRGANGSEGDKENTPPDKVARREDSSLTRFFERLLETEKI